MDKDQADKIVKLTFENKFNEENFDFFINSISNNFSRASNNLWINNKDFKNDLDKKINKYKIIGKIICDSNEEILVGIVKLKSYSYVEKSRFSQRLIAKFLLEKNNCDNCILAFYDEQTSDWRFSLITIGYTKGANKTGKFIIKKELSSLKRYSFLVGENEPCFTAKSQLAPLLIKKIQNLTDIEKAFSLEKISDEFFEKYKYLCFKISNELKNLRINDKKINDDFKKHYLTELDFAKKLMGQIIFLYFIQKKGWIGIKKNIDGNFDNWGKGPKNFLRQLFDKKYCDYKNFFNDVLEDLFYVGLAFDLPNNYYPKLDCKLPFLSGGLFEPINDYNWLETDISIKNETFKEILDTFDLFNFTVNEDASLEKEIAIDPETLGKVFENLIDENIRRGDGVFYTPREIVEYMCQSSISVYLKNNCKVNLTYLESKKIINEICLKEINVSNDLNELNTTTKNFIIENSKHLDELFSNIKVCDPAIGSGAFAVTMMNLIVKLRKVVNFSNLSNVYNYDYKLKLNFINNSIYGVDIDRSAVDIAKLRLWLSLTIDENNYEKISTLPNLDYKILQGNSLFDDLGGDLSFSNNLNQLSLIEKDEKGEALIEDYFDKIKKYNLLVNQNEKKVERDEINEILKKIILYKIKGIKNFDKNDPKITQLLINLDDIDKKKVDFFSWNIIFNKLFNKYGGFDIILANPPYIRQEDIVKYKERLSKKYSIYNSTSDIYTYFFELSKSLLNKNGTGVFITSNKWMRAKYGKNLRVFFKDKLLINELMNFGSNHVFENADTNTNITIFENKEINDQIIEYSELKKDQKIDNLNSYFLDNKISIPKKNLDINNFYFLDGDNQNLYSKLVARGTPLKKLPYKIYYGIKTAFNEAFLISTKTKNIILQKNQKCKKFFKPILRGRDLSKNGYKFKDLWMITIPSGWTINNYKNKNPEKSFKKDYKEIINHLENIEEKFQKNTKKTKSKGLYKRGDQGDFWWELRDCDYYDLFSKKKIIWIELSDKNKFSICNENYYLLAGSFMIIGEHLELLISFLNSRVCLYMFGTICNSSGMSTSQWKKFALEKINIPLGIDDKIKQKLINKQMNITSEIDIALKKKIEKEIDQIYYEIYNLSQKEIEIIENSN